MKIGIIGGGQLGKMFIEEAHRWNTTCFFLEAQQDTPAAIVCKNQLLGSLQDAEAIRNLASHVDVLTYEIEHINVDVLFELEKQGKKVIPSASVLAFIQNKYFQKKFFLENKILSADFYEVFEAEFFFEALQKIKSEKVVIKTMKGGYDGKGVLILNKKDILENNLPFEGKNCILEECINFSKEISVMVARNENGEIVAFPPVEMEFDPTGNLVKYVFSPANISETILNKSKEIAKETILKMNGIGIFAVEMFLDKNENIFVNEIAPRPHNSGHQTIEGSFTSQYEMLLRILLNKPLGNPENRCPSAMINIVGPEDVIGDYELDGENEILKIQGVYVHMYGKSTTKHLRKLGHITVLGESKEDLTEKIKTIEKHIKIVAAKV